MAELVELALLEEKAGEERPARTATATGTGPTAKTPPASSAGRIAEAASLASRLLVLKRGPLKDHFAIEITPQGRLAALPEIVDGVAWRPSQLPRLALALARDVDFSGGEQRFFETAAEALASCVSLPGWSEEDDEEEGEEEERRRGRRRREGRRKARRKRKKPRRRRERRASSTAPRRGASSAASPTSSSRPCGSTSGPRERAPRTAPWSS